MSPENFPRLIAFYLPQYHPIPENDEWWGKGFTEWTNVTKARPLFMGHYQPHLPADLGFYDLRLPEARQAQADLARAAGIEGFCYWHYWFGGKRLLERPFNEVLHSRSPDLPFCLAWANQTWTGTWHGEPDRVLIEQTYPGLEDHENHFFEVLNAFKDSRYITVDEKPVFIIFEPRKLPDAGQFVELWQRLSKENGLKGIYFLGLANSVWDYKSVNFDGVIINSFPILLSELLQKTKLVPSTKDFAPLTREEDLLGENKKPQIFSYKDFVSLGLPALDLQKEQYPMVIPNWDNTPRSGVNGYVLEGATPNLFRKQLLEAYSQVRGHSVEKKIVFIKSWNEWAEGNYLEPDQKYGDGYIRVISESLRDWNLDDIVAKNGKKDNHLSVVIPVYNASLYITQAVESALAQAETDEVLLVEDGSQDDSLRTCLELEDKYDKVRVFRHAGGANLGASASRNLGMKNCRCEFIAFLDASDYYLDGRFEKAMEIFAAEPGCEGVYDAIGIQFEDQFGEKSYKSSGLADIKLTTLTKRVPAEKLFQRLLAGGAGHFHMDGLVIRRHLLEKVGYLNGSSYPLFEEIAFILRLAAVGTLLPGSLAYPVGMRRVHAHTVILEPLSDAQKAQERMKMRIATYRWCRRHATKEKRQLVLERMISTHLAYSSRKRNGVGKYLGRRLKFLKLFTLPIKCVDVLIDIAFWQVFLRSAQKFFRSV